MANGTLRPSISEAAAMQGLAVELLQAIRTYTRIADGGFLDDLAPNMPVFIRLLERNEALGKSLEPYHTGSGLHHTLEHI